MRGTRARQLRRLAESNPGMNDPKLRRLIERYQAANRHRALKKLYKERRRSTWNTSKPRTSRAWRKGRRLPVSLRSAQQRRADRRLARRISNPGWEVWRERRYQKDLRREQARKARLKRVLHFAASLLRGRRAWRPTKK